MELLPEECIAHILSGVSPQDACRSSAVSSIVRDAAESELLWEKLLPPDYRQIVSKAVSPVTFTSKTELFVKLSTTLLIDGGCKAFTIDKPTGKKRYILSATELYIAWSSNPLFWCWKPLAQSRFPEVVELVMVSWLEIQGKINTRMLSPKTLYVAYLIVQVSQRAYGLDTLPSEVSIEIGDYQSRGTIYLSLIDCCKKPTDSICYPVEGLGPGGVVLQGAERAVFYEREDGWLEIKLGEFFNDGKSEEDVKMSLREVNGVHLKGGLIVEGIEVRPK